MTDWELINEIADNDMLEFESIESDIDTQNLYENAVSIQGTMKYCFGSQLVAQQRFTD